MAGAPHSARQARENQSQLPHPNVEPHDVRMGHPRGSYWNQGLCSLDAFECATRQDTHQGNTRKLSRTAFVRFHPQDTNQFPFEWLERQYVGYGTSIGKLYINIDLPVEFCKVAFMFRV